MNRRLWLLAGAALLCADVAPVRAQGQAQGAGQNARSRLWEPRDARRAQGAVEAVTATPLPADGSAPPALPATPPPPRPLVPQVDRTAPVTFTAGSISYDEPSQTVVAVGRVEAWQGDRVLQADRVTFDRATGIARAEGNVVLLEPDGQVLFAERAELNQDFSAGVASGMRGLLADNGRLAATAARRREGRLTEMFQSVYTTCDACERDPQRAPLWQIAARRAQHDQQLKRVEYWNGTLQMAGIPVFWVPYLYHPDPTVERASGLLPPLLGQSRRLGAFFSLPYYWVIDEQSDATIEPIITTRERGVLAGEYRRRFDSGYVTFRGSGTNDSDTDWRGHILGAGRFTLNDTWRAGFDLGRTSDIAYMRDYRFGSPRFLTTRPFAEAFPGRGYALIDAATYQGLRITDSDKRSPQVLPRFFYDYTGPQGWLGGRFAFDVGSYNIFRQQGTDTRRAGGRVGWASEITDRLGARWGFGARLDLYGYNFSDFAAANRRNNDGSAGVAHPQAFVMWRLPLFRRFGAVTHVVEPIVQGVVGPNTTRGRFPNEDSRDVEFTDANLFALNRFPGRDRLEGGARINYGVRNTLFLANGASLEAMFGQSLRAHRDDTFDQQSGLSGRASDYVTRLSASPASWLNLAYRARFANDQARQTFSDISATVGERPFSVSASYVLVPPSVTGNRETRREEVGGGVRVGPFENTRLSHWRGLASAYYDLEQNRFVSTAFGAVYEDECFVFDVRYVRSFTNPALRAEGGTAVVFQLQFKTVGDFGFSAF
jgi:LPS-assembly protein